jgi:hypothetical protein
MKSFQWKVWWDDRAVVWQYAIHNFPFFFVLIPSGEFRVAGYVFYGYESPDGEISGLFRLFF